MLCLTAVSEGTMAACILCPPHAGPSQVRIFLQINHFYWALWAINMAVSEGCASFAYLNYSHNRLAEVSAFASPRSVRIRVTILSGSQRKIRSDGVDFVLPGSTVEGNKLELPKPRSHLLAPTPVHIRRSCCGGQESCRDCITAC